MYNQRIIFHQMVGPVLEYWYNAVRPEILCAKLPIVRCIGYRMTVGNCINGNVFSMPCVRHSYEFIAWVSLILKKNLKKRLLLFPEAQREEEN